MAINEKDVDVLARDFVRTLLKDWGADDSDEEQEIECIQDYIVTK